MDFHDPVASGTHLFTACWALFATLILVRMSHQRPLIERLAIGFFGLSMVILYLASGLYHGLLHRTEADRVVWLRLDRSAIFLLILGSSVPTYAIYLSGWKRQLSMTVMSTIAIVGIACQWLNTVTQPVAIFTYVSMSVIGAGTIPWWIRSVPAGGMKWFSAAMGLYIVGAIIEAMQWPNPVPDMITHHELLHVLDMAGSLAHFGFVTRFVLKTDPLSSESYDLSTEPNSPEPEACFPAVTTSAIT